MIALLCDLLDSHAFLNKFNIYVEYEMSHPYHHYLSLITTEESHQGQKMIHFWCGKIQSKFPSFAEDLLPFLLVNITSNVEFYCVRRFVALNGSFDGKRDFFPRCNFMKSISAQSILVSVNASIFCFHPTV